MRQAGVGHVDVPQIERFESHEPSQVCQARVGNRRRAEVKPAQWRELSDVCQTFVCDGGGVQVQIAQVRKLDEQLQTGVFEVAVSEIDRDDRPARELVVAGDAGLDLL